MVPSRDGAVLVDALGLVAVQSKGNLTQISSAMNLTSFSYRMLLRAGMRAFAGAVVDVLRRVALSVWAVSGQESVFYSTPLV